MLLFYLPTAGSQTRLSVQCLLSGVLVILSIELLSRSINNYPTIKGIQVNKHELKISQRAFWSRNKYH